MKVSREDTARAQTGAKQKSADTGLVRLGYAALAAADIDTLTKTIDEDVSSSGDIVQSRAAASGVCVRVLTVPASTPRVLAAAMIFTVASVLGTAAGHASGMPMSNRGAPAVMTLSQPPHCVRPQVYVQGSGCVVVRTNPTKNVPTKETAGCTFPMVKQGTACVCAQDYSPNGNACIKSLVAKKAPPTIGKQEQPPVHVDQPPVVVTAAPAASGSAGSAVDNGKGGSVAPAAPAVVAATPIGSHPTVVFIPVPGEKIVVIPFDAQ